jgi:exopolysaccharide production protein ExoQ
MPTSPFRIASVALGLFILTNGPVFYITDRVLGGEFGWEQPFTRQVFIAVALTAFTVIVFDRFDESGPQLMRPSPVAASAVALFTGWVVLSSLWSLAPDLTRGRSLIYVGLAAFAWIVADLDFARFRSALGLAVGVALAASVLAVLLSDSIGVDRNDDWRGIYTNRNSLAPIAALGVIVGLSFLATARRDRRIGAALLPLVSTVVILGSGSRTAVLALAVAIGSSLLLVAARVGQERYGRWARIAAGVVAATGALALTAVISQMWSEPTLAQRRSIWSLVWDRIGERPVHGHGWFSIWTVPEFTSIDPLLGRGSAHGSFLEVWLGLGLLGLIPFLLIVGLALFGTVRAAWREPSVASATWLAIVIFLLIENLTESFVLWFSYNWVLLMAAALRSGVRWPRARGPRMRPSSESVTV